jgi:hypothetical protein
VETGCLGARCAESCSVPRPVASGQAQRFIAKTLLPLSVLTVLALLCAGVAAADKPFPNCGLALTVIAAGVPGVDTTELADTGCILGKCLESTKKDDGTSVCHLSRSASLYRNCLPSAAAARRAVAMMFTRAFMPGINPKAVKRAVFPGASLVAVATIATPPANGGGAESGTLVMFSVGKAVVRFEVGAGSDDDPNPTWAAARTIALEGAKELAKSWAKRPTAASC